MDRRSLLLLVPAAALVGTGGWMLWGRDSAGPALGSVSAQEAADIDTSGIPDMAIGSPDAKVTVIEYASFTCPHCRNFHDTVYGQLKQNYIDTGKIRFVYREVYFDRFGLWAAMIARCGGEMRYFGIADMIFNTQDEWTQGDPAQIADNLRKIGRTAGISDAELDACMNDGDMAQKLVALYQKNATADGVDSTPTFFVNGTKYSNMGYEEFAAILDEELAK
jgi:protein-disulfide isomerase